MAQQADPGEVFEAVYESGVAGLAGTVAVAIHDNQAVVVYGPTTLQIVELIVDGEGTGTYRANLTAPADEGQYTIKWSNDGSFDPDAGEGTEDLLVEDSTFTLPSLGPSIEDSVLCSAWTTAEEVVECCSVEIGSDTSLLEAAVVAASEWLYLASGKQYAGVCERTVRPCKTSNCWCGVQVLPRGYVIGWDGSCWQGHSCGCGPVSRVKLAGRAREVSEVLIDGVAVDPATYMLEGGRWLVRVSPDTWPSCQALDLPDTEEGTFSVTYSYGKAPPVYGQLAARALACEIVKGCTPGVECAFPPGAIRVTRQGISMERATLARTKEGIWQTGMNDVDLFLNTVNPHGVQRRATFTSPSNANRYARPNPV